MSQITALTSFGPESDSSISNFTRAKEELIPIKPLLESQKQEMELCDPEKELYHLPSSYSRQNSLDNQFFQIQKIILDFLPKAHMTIKKKKEFEGDKNYFEFTVTLNDATIHYESLGEIFVEIHRRIYWEVQPKLAYSIVFK